MEQKSRYLMFSLMLICDQDVCLFIHHILFIVNVNELGLLLPYRISIQNANLSIIVKSFWKIAQCMTVSLPYFV